MILLIDNYDSFTYNVSQAFEMLKTNVRVVRNDKITLDEINEARPTHIVISPGPGRPVDAGITVDVIRAFAEKIPVLGICLGHQAIAYAFGGEVGYAPKMMHGKPSRIFHDGKTLFHGVRNPFCAGRYHSLIVKEEGLPGCLAVSCYTLEGEIMGIRHKDYPVEGVQFHPESIMTEEGLSLFKNFLRL